MVERKECEDVERKECDAQDKHDVIPIFCLFGKCQRAPSVRHPALEEGEIPKFCKQPIHIKPKCAGCGECFFRKSRAGQLIEGLDRVSLGLEDHVMSPGWDVVYKKHHMEDDMLYREYPRRCPPCLVKFVAKRCRCEIRGSCARRPVTCHACVFSETHKEGQCPGSG